MIVTCNNEDITSVFDYIGEDYGKCLYIYIDLKKYGIDDENFNVWIQYNENEDICAIISEILWRNPNIQQKAGFYS